MTTAEIQTELLRCQEGYRRHAPPDGDPVMRTAFLLNWFVVKAWAENAKIGE